MQRAMTSRVRASALPTAAARYRAGLGQQMRFAHKVRLTRLMRCLMALMH